MSQSAGGKKESEAQLLHAGLAQDEANLRKYETEVIPEMEARVLEMEGYIEAVEDEIKTRENLKLLRETQGDSDALAKIELDHDARMNALMRDAFEETRNVVANSAAKAEVEMTSATSTRRRAAMAELP